LLDGAFGSAEYALAHLVVARRVERPVPPVQGRRS